MPQFQLGQWEGHILSSLPFYMLLLPLLLELIKSRVSSQATKALQDLAKVTQVQTPLTAIFPAFFFQQDMPASAVGGAAVCVCQAYANLCESAGRHALVAASQQAPKIEVEHSRGRLHNF